MPIVIEAYTPGGYGNYIEGIGTLKANGGDCGGGSETLIVETLVFDEGQITNPMQGSNPQWGGQCHSLTGNAGRTVVIIREVDMTYQEVTGTLNPGAHPGSYNGQDAYNDMLITDENDNYKPQLYAHGRDNGRDSQRIGGNGLQRPTDSNGHRGGVKL